MRSLRNCLLALCLALVGTQGLFAADTPVKTLRPPSVPLVACDPYFSIWSPSDNLTDADTVHWTGKPHSLNALVRIDGQAFRLMGKQPANVDPLPQRSLEVLPTRTIYTLGNNQVKLTLTFMTPALPDDLHVLSRPLTYITWNVASADGKSHQVDLYLSAASEIVINTPEQVVSGGPVKFEATAGGAAKSEKIVAVQMGSVAQPILGKKGDNLRIDWGYAYLGIPEQAGAKLAYGPVEKSAQQFAAGQALPENSTAPAAPKDRLDGMALTVDCGKVGDKAVSRFAMLAYDDIYSIKYFSDKLRGFWRQNGLDGPGLLKLAAAQYADLTKRCQAFDAELMADLERAGGIKYALIGALAYREAHAGCKLAADRAGQPLLFPKENFSNGCIATVDVIYPMAPQFLLLSPALAKASVANILEYSMSPRWKFPFAPHDLGTYPYATGQVYGGGERTEDNQMPVEESGNMLILMAAIAKVEGNAEFSRKYWPALTKWAEFLKSKGLDPDNQLCTDDFAGHLAHNVNLSAKAICGLAAYSQLCEMLGKKTEAAEYQKLAADFSQRWIKMAYDGDHFRLAFDKPGTWSQKYNLVWDRVLQLKLFPADVAQKELAFYRRQQNEYGLPLDSRKEYTKLDWITWTACLTGDRADFEALISPVYDFINSTPSRVPLTDWYQTKTAKMVGFQARPVLGGVFIRLLDDPAVWKKWAARGVQTTKDWAPLPPTPVMKIVVPTARDEAAEWRFTTEKPGANWMKADFADNSWKAGPAGFGTPMTPGGKVRTRWNSDDIWLRRTFTLADAKADNLKLYVHHDEDAEIYLNGVLAATLGGFTTEYELVDIAAAAKATLKSGSNVISIHCHQTTGGQYIDAGLVIETTPAAGK